MPAERYRRVNLRRPVWVAGFVFALFPATALFPRIVASVGVRDSYGTAAVAVASLLVATGFSQQAWARWHRKASRLEMVGVTVSSRWRNLINPLFWLRLPATEPEGTGG